MTSFLQSLFALTILIHSISRTVNAAAPAVDVSPEPVNETQAKQLLVPGCIHSCLGLKNSMISAGIVAASGEYSIWIPRLNSHITVYCEMGLNGGGYTFLRPFDLPRLIDSDIQYLISDRSSILMRVRLMDGSQPYGVLQQLLGTTITVRLNSWAGYTSPLNLVPLSTPYLFFGFLSPAVLPKGFRVNNNPLSFPAGSASNFALFADFNELPFASQTPTSSALITTFFSYFKSNPSRRVMNSEYFTFMEMYHGGGFFQTDGRVGFEKILSAAIGFR